MPRRRFLFSVPPLMPGIPPQAPQDAKTIFQCQAHGMSIRSQAGFAVRINSPL